MNAMQPPQSIEEIKEGLETTEKGGVRQSIRNCHINIGTGKEITIAQLADKIVKEELLKQHSVMIWFTGLSGSCTDCLFCRS